MRILTIVFLSLFTLSSMGQVPNRIKENQIIRKINRKHIKIPNIDGYITLKGDFHMHTVFSDGIVWPTLRVQEAWSEGLDAIAITDHVKPASRINKRRKKYTTGDQNSPYEVAESTADKLNILLVKGGELTQKMPPGHINALFMKDVNVLAQEDAMKAVKDANEQGAFVVWNHPGWAFHQDSTQWREFHEKAYQKGWLHGVEVFNYNEWYPVVIDWCADKKLSIFANTDLHYVASHSYEYNSHLRPMTLVFTKNRSLEALKEAMFAHRTVAVFAEQMAGDEKYLSELFYKSIQIIPCKVQKGTIYFQIINNTDLTFRLKLVDSGFNGPRNIDLLPNSEVFAKCKNVKGAKLKYEVTNCHIRSDKNLTVDIHVPEMK